MNPLSQVVSLLLRGIGLISWNVLQIVVNYETRKRYTNTLPAN